MLPFINHQMLRQSVAAPTDPYFANTVLLLSGDGTNGSQTFTDESFAARGNGSTVAGLNTDTNVSTAIKAFGSGSIRYDGGRNDSLSFADHSDWTLGTSDFTIEGFFYHEQNTAIETMLSHYNASGNQRGWLFHYRGSDPTPVLRFTASASTSNGSSAAAIVEGNWTPSIQTFYYYCAERSGSTFRIYEGPMGGTASMLAKATSTINIFDSNSTLRLGCLGNTTDCWYGNIDEPRITLGVARYNTDAGFAVPTAAFPRS